MAEEEADIPIEPTLAGRAGRQGIEPGFRQREWIPAFRQEGLDGPVAGIGNLQGAATGGFQPDRAVGLAQAQAPRDGAPVVEDPISEPLLSQRVAGRSGLLGLLSTPLGIVETVRQRGRGERIVHRRPGAGTEPAGMGGDQDRVLEHRDPRGGRFQPELLADPAERDGVQTVVKLDVGIAVDLDLGPAGRHGRHGGHRLQQRLLGLGEGGQGSLPGGAMAAIAGGLQHPGPPRLIGIGQTAEVPQRQEVALDVCDAGLDPAFFLRLPGWAGGKAAAVARGELAIGALDVGIMKAGAGNRTLGIVDNHPSRYAVEPLEGAPMAGQPGPAGLLFDQLGLLMAAPAEGHHTPPARPQFTGVGIDQSRSTPEVDLDRVAGGKLQDHRGVRDGGLETLQKPGDRQIAPAKPLLPHPRLIDRGPLDPGLPPGGDRLPIGFHQGLRRGGYRRRRRR